VTGVVSNDPNKAFQQFKSGEQAGKMAGRVLLAQGLHLRVPDGNRGLRQDHKEFSDRGAQLFGVSIDSEFVHLAWRKDKEELRNLPFPMLSDIKRELSSALGHPR